MGFGFDAGEMEVNKSKVHWGTYQLVDVSCARGLDVILPGAVTHSCLLLFSPTRPNTALISKYYASLQSQEPADIVEKGAEGDETVCTSWRRGPMVLFNPLSLLHFTHITTRPHRPACRKHASVGSPTTPWHHLRSCASKCQTCESVARRRRTILPLVGPDAQPYTNVFSSFASSIS